MQSEQENTNKINYCEKKNHNQIIVHFFLDCLLIGKCLCCVCQYLFRKRVEKNTLMICIACILM